MIKGIWMWPNNVYRCGAEKIISALKHARFTDIYFLTKGLSGKTSFIGKHAPAAFDRDLLNEVIDCAHRYGIRVHAWFTSASDEYYKSIHPESGRAHFSRGKDRELISFKNDAYRDYLKRIVDEVVSDYAVDGIHLDYIRYNHMLYGWDDEDISAYLSFGADKKELFGFIEKTFYSEDRDESIFEEYRRGNETLKAFCKSRKADVNGFSEYILNGVKKIKPNLVLSAAVMPEGAYRDHAFADLHYGQDYDDLSRLFDYFLVMSYSKAYGKTSEWISDIGKNLTDKNISFVTGIQTYDHADGASIQSDIGSALGASNNGIVLFREGECAIVYNDCGMQLFNDTDYKITKAEYRYGNKSEISNLVIMPGQTAPLNLSLIPDQILLYSEDKDVCIYYDKRHFEKGNKSC